MSAVFSPRGPSQVPEPITEPVTDGKPLAGPANPEAVVFHLPAQDAAQSAPTEPPAQAPALMLAPQPSPESGSTTSPAVQSMEDGPDLPTFHRQSAAALAQAGAEPEDARPGALLACLDRWCVTPVCCGDRELAACCCLLLTVGAVTGAVLGARGDY